MQHNYSVYKPRPSHSLIQYRHRVEEPRPSHSLIQYFECIDALEICNRIKFDFYLDGHMCNVQVRVTTESFVVCDFVATLWFLHPPLSCGQAS